MFQILSFDSQEADVREETAASEAPELQLKQTVKFLPTHLSHVYSAAEKLVIAGQGSRCDPCLREAQETTDLVTFSLNGNVTEPEASDAVPGSLLSKCSAHRLCGRMPVRVATTICNRWLIDVVFKNRPTGGSNAGKPGSVGRLEVNSTRPEEGIVNETGMAGRPGVNSTRLEGVIARETSIAGRPGVNSTRPEECNTHETGAADRPGVNSMRPEGLQSTIVCACQSWICRLSKPRMTSLHV
jgi:hypothetical protein